MFRNRTEAFIWLQQASQLMLKDPTLIGLPWEPQPLPPSSIVSCVETRTSRQWQHLSSAPSHQARRARVLLLFLATMLQPSSHPILPLHPTLPSLPLLLEAFKAMMPQSMPATRQIAQEASSEMQARWLIYLHTGASLVLDPQQTERPLICEATSASEAMWTYRQEMWALTRLSISLQQVGGRSLSPRKRWISLEC